MFYGNCVVRRYICVNDPFASSDKEKTVPITAYSREARTELDTQQWLERNGYSAQRVSTYDDIPQELRIKVASDIECSCCAVAGATLVRAAHSRATGKAIGQGHFRFGDRHNALCDYADEQAATGGEYLTKFAEDRSDVTKTIRQLVCNGIAGGLFTQADMRQMRVWFLQEKEQHAVAVDVPGELMNWCIAAWRTKPWSHEKYPFHPDQGQLPNFDWQRAAELEWNRRSTGVICQDDDDVPYYRSPAVKRAETLIARFGGKVVLDPTALMEKYKDSLTLARFSAKYVFDDRKNCFSTHESTWGPKGHAMLALSALLLFKSAWNLDAAVSLSIRLITLPQMGTGLEGNLIGLNPFHDYEAWRVVKAAQRVGVKRTDLRPVQDQVASVLAEMKEQWAAWKGRQSH